MGSAVWDRGRYGECRSDPVLRPVHHDQFQEVLDRKRSRVRLQFNTYFMNFFISLRKDQVSKEDILSFAVLKMNHQHASLKLFVFHGSKLTKFHFETQALTSTGCAIISLITPPVSALAIWMHWLKRRSSRRADVLIFN